MRSTLSEPVRDRIPQSKDCPLARVPHEGACAYLGKQGGCLHESFIVIYRVDSRRPSWPMWDIGNNGNGTELKESM